MNQKKQRTLAIFALAVALVATTVAYAVLQTTLNISGSITKKGGTWAINIQNISTVTTTGSGKMTTAPKVSGTTLSFASELSKPGDSVSFTFDIVNNGTLAAQMYGYEASMSINGVRGSLTSYSEMVVKSEDIIYQLEMKNSDGVFSNTQYLAEDRLVIAAKGKQTFRLTLKYNSSASSVSASDKALAVSATFPFTQA